MLGIELDGITHHEDAVIAKDKIKEQRMNDLGITVLRFRDEEVYHHMNSVILEVEQFVDDFESLSRNHTLDLIKTTIWLSEEETFHLILFES